MAPKPLSRRLPAVLPATLAVLSALFVWYSNRQLVEFGKKVDALLANDPDFPVCGFPSIGPTMYARLFAALTIVAVAMTIAIAYDLPKAYRWMFLLTAATCFVGAFVASWPPSTHWGFDAEYLASGGLSVSAYFASRRWRQT
jgi:hypothetical protein